MEKLRSNTDKLVICGQALSHCVNYTVRDIVSYWNISSATANLTATADGDDDEKKEMRNNKNNNITILKDCASSVPGFEEAGGTIPQGYDSGGCECRNFGLFYALVE